MNAPRPRLLFVDDEPALRTTVPALLEMEGFEVVAAATVSEALHLITTKKFDVLLSDLNIGELSDGFTVVSAMRRSQPECRTLILTGFPDFDNALEHIRQQADGYILKPTRAQSLAETIRQRLAAPNGKHLSERMRLSYVIHHGKSLVINRWLKEVKADAELNEIKLSDAERIDHLPVMLDEVVVALGADRPLVQSQSHMRDEALQAARTHGTQRKRQGYSVELVFKEARILQCQLFDIAQENLLDLDMSAVIADLTRITDTIEVLVAEAIQAFISSGQRAA